MSKFLFYLGINLCSLAFLSATIFAICKGWNIWAVAFFFVSVSAGRTAATKDD